WSVLVAVGPGWSAYEWAKIHPYELSYYNIGLARAVDEGFVATYWYDAATPRFLREADRLLPPDASVVVHVHPLINPEVFFTLQSMGRLRADLKQEPTDPEEFPWVWLLTHSSKATAFTKLMHACPPALSTGPENVRLTSLVDPKSVALAWGLHALCVASDDTVELGPLRLHEEVFTAGASAIKKAAAVIREKGAEHDVSNEDQEVRSLIAAWTKNPALKSGLERLRRRDPDALTAAAAVVARRPKDVLAVLQSPGYQRPEKFGGEFRVEGVQDER
ncbi:MAG: hypothetical protein ACRDD1_19945, partial [Planctomycetia bacterium]